MKLKTTLPILALALCGGISQAASPQTPLTGMKLDLGKKATRIQAHQSTFPAFAATDDDAPEFISQVPAGAESKLYSRDWRGFWVLNYMSTWILQGYEDGRVQYLFFDGDDVYYPTPVLSFEAPSFIKGKKTANGITFPLPQCVYSYNETENGEQVRKDYFIDFLYYDPDYGHYYTSDAAVTHSLDLTLLPDGSYTWENTDQTIVIPDPETGQEVKYMYRICGIVNQDEAWCGWGDFQMDLNLFTQEPMTDIPTEAKTTLMTLTAGDLEKTVAVGFLDDKIWIRGMSQENPNSWIEGTLKDGVVTFGRQYVGIDAEQTYFARFSGATSEMGWNDVLDQPELKVTPIEYAEFDYYPETYTLAARTDAIIAGGMECDITIEFLEKPVLRGQADTMVPATPVIDSWYNYNPDFGYGRMTFTAPAISQTGAQIDPELLSWSLEIDGEMYTWEPSSHKKFPEAMTWIPYQFSDKNDVIIDGDSRKIYFRKNVEYYAAIRLRTIDGEEYLTSLFALAKTDKFNIEDWPALEDELSFVSLPTEGTSEVISHEYYDLSGRRLTNTPAKGLYLDCLINADGSRKIRKIIK